MRKIYAYVTIKKEFEIYEPLLEEVIDDLNPTNQYEFNVLLDEYSDEIGDSRFEKLITEQNAFKIKLEEVLLSEAILNQINLKDGDQMCDLRIEGTDGTILVQK